MDQNVQGEATTSYYELRNRMLFNETLILITLIFIAQILFLVILRHKLDDV